MVSLTVVLLALILSFGGAYLVYKMNRKEVPHHAKRTATRRH
ncbi:hypothetical protein [Bdellovibrio sp. HCB2-146]